MKSRSILRSVLAFCLALAMCVAMAVPTFAIGGSSSSSSSSFAGGSGTAADPYQISTISQLVNINKDLKASYKLVNDLDFSNYIAWLPIGYYSIDVAAMLQGDESVPAAIAFQGDFDGDGHTIKNFNFTSVNPMAGGIFGFTSGDAKVHDVNLENFTTTSALCAGSIIGWASGNTELYNINATNCNNRAVTYAGAVIGSSNGNVTIHDCHVKGGSATIGLTLLNDQVNIYKNYGGAGGIVGGGDCTSFKDCSVTDFRVKVNSYENDGFGGLAGCANEAKYVTNCYAENITIEALTGSHGYIGGLIGFTGSEAGIEDASKRSVVSNCYAKNVKILASDETTCIGGLIGGGTYRSDEQPVPFSFLIKDCSVENIEITSGGKYIGAVLGYLTPNSAVQNSLITNVTLNGSPLTQEIGATTSTVPYKTLPQFGASM